ncbi:MAG: DUF885 domain-containing protein [Clostridiales bacterium]|nr:DUF885 domain-containing protein [Clostridiales bacterium]
MKKRTKLMAVAMSGVMSVSAMFGLAGCNRKRYTPEMLEDLGLDFALTLMGSDAFVWNAFSATPYETYGFVVSDNSSWYSYSGVMDSYSKNMINTMFGLYADELSHYNLSELSGSAALTYRALDNALGLYQSYYNSKYIKKFELLGGSYISKEGGYVADFAQSFENFEFRTEKDVQTLLKVTQSTGDAFESYLNFARDRDSMGYPLYDYTLNAMRDYLDDVYEKGEEFYLYALADKKIDDAEFLNEASKTQYKSDYKRALDESYMEGVKALYDGLDEYTGKVTKVEQSYLASAGAAGKAYYEWLFRQKTGIKNANITKIYNELVVAYNDYLNKMDGAVATIDALQTTDKATYDEFYEYYNETKVLLGLTDPNEILEYLKTAAKDIVPDLKTQPDIGFKYMDDTVAEITNSLAYYMRTPLDLTDASENITLNGYQMEQNPTDLLTTIAHEGYPGHLYAYVSAKENGASLLSNCTTTLAFSEGWANYVELVLLDNIAQTADTATAKYCEYKKYETLAGYTSMVLYDMRVNYFGDTATDLGRSDIIERLMEIPAAYVPYGYGMYTIYTLHEKAKSSLGSKYSETDFNGALLAEGFGPTLTRAQQITDNYIKKHK